MGIEQKGTKREQFSGKAMSMSLNYTEPTTRTELIVGCMG